MSIHEFTVTRDIWSKIFQNGKMIEKTTKHVTVPQARRQSFLQMYKLRIVVVVSKIKMPQLLDFL